MIKATHALLMVSGILGNNNSDKESGDMTNDAKNALLAIFQKVAYVDNDGQSYYNELQEALFNVTVLSITAVFEQGSAVIYTNDTLDDLKQYLTVTAQYDDGTSGVVTGYTLSGELTAGTNTITVTYNQQTTTFTVTAVVNGWYYPFNGSLLSSGSEEFGFVGEAVFDDGLFGRQAYSRIIPADTPVDDRQAGIHANNLSKFPAFGGDYTLSFWCKAQSTSGVYPFWATYFQTGNSNVYYYSSSQAVASGWSVTHLSYNGLANAGYGFQIYQNKINLRISASTPTTSGSINVTPPSSFAFTDWHHYAVTRKGSTVRLFVDGALICTATAANNTVFPANQVAIADYFKNSSGSTYTDVVRTGNGALVQDLYVAEFCKWESAFDPQSIVY